MIKPHGQFSTTWLKSLRTLHRWPINPVVYREPLVMTSMKGDLVLRWVSHLDAFSGYPDQT